MKKIFTLFSSVSLLWFSGYAAGPSSYCVSKGTNTTHGYINKVSMETINNTSGNNGGYGNFTSQSATLFKGDDYTVQLTPGFISGAAYFEYWTVYIDYNQDGIFEPNELVGKGHNAITVHVSVNVPASALSGATRMRIQMQAGAYETDPCATYTYGEVEDYKVVLASATKDEAIAGLNTTSEPESSANFLLYPNPASENILVTQITGLTGEANLDIINLTGQVVASYKITETGKSIPVNELPMGNYFIRVYNGEMNVVRQLIKI